MRDIIFVSYLVENPENVREFEKAGKRGRLIEWTTKRSAKEGDLHLFWLGAPFSELRGIGVLKGETTTHLAEFDWTDSDRQSFADFDPFVRLTVPIGLHELKSDPILANWWLSHPYQGTAKTVLKNPKAARRLLRRIAERNPAARRLLEPYEDQLSGAQRTSQNAAARRDDANVLRDLAQLDPPLRKMVMETVRRAVRDQRLRNEVLPLWNQACAACGLRLRANSLFECEVAHIRSVADLGPDTRANALRIRSAKAVRDSGDHAVAAGLSTPSAA